MNLHLATEKYTAANITCIFKTINVYHVVKEENKETKEGQWQKHPKKGFNYYNNKTKKSNNKSTNGIKLGNEFRIYTASSDQNIFWRLIKCYLQHISASSI